MPETEFSGRGFRARAGTLTLLYLTSSLDREVALRLLAQSSTGVDLIEDWELPEEDDPPDVDQVFADRYLLEAVDPNADRDDPDTVLRPTPAGREVPFLAATLQRWLDLHPNGPLELRGEAGSVLWPVVSGWSTGVIHAFAPGPRTAVEACEAIQVLDLEIVESCMDMMEDAGQLEAQPCEEDEDEPFAVTDWLRLATAPLAVAARLELRHPPGDTAPIAALDVEAAFHLTLPLLRLPGSFSGTCALAVELDEDVSGSPAGVTARIEKGRIVSCESGIEPGADTWASASAADWLDTVIEGNVKRVRSGGNRRLARRLLRQLHRTLFGVAVG